MTLHVLSSAAAFAGADPEALRLEQQVGAILRNLEEEQYLLADQMLDQALALTGADHPFRITLLKRRGKLYRLQSRFGESLAVYQPALELSERLLGLAHRESRRLRQKICKVHEYMQFRSGLTPAQQDEHVRLALECIMSGREQALASGQLAAAAVLLGDLAAYARAWYYHCPSSLSRERYNRALELSKDALSELKAHRAELASALKEEPGETAAHLGWLFADNYAWGEALAEFRVASRLLGREHPSRCHLAWSIREAEWELYGDEYDYDGGRRR